MRTRWTRGPAAWLLANLALCGCTTAPAYFYTLSSTLPPAEKSVLLPDQGPAVGIGPVRFPEFLARPQIVSRATANRLLVNEFHRWGGSLEDDFPRVLGENLGQLLGTSRILVEPAEARFPLDFRVTADILRFAGTPEGAAVFKVRWGVLDGYGEHTLQVRESTYRRRAANAQPEAMIAALSETLAAFSRDLARQLRELPRPAAKPPGPTLGDIGI
ncbi:MAG: PqiC family protein [Candidatus Thiosymbion ectosymbiont of Robbea hypermnestra]|nr:PqiC family protein [Candidatus Thiosymbion ectosymbiont of Robbea hypermnestra]